MDAFPHSEITDITMSTSSVTNRIRSKYRRLCADRLFRRPFPISSVTPLISFTFDDFPETALSVGGSILREAGALGTYFVSLSLAGKDDASGRMYQLDDLVKLQEQGHELGCHTFGHCDSSETESKVFVDSVISNQSALESVIPGAVFRSFSFPKSAPRAQTKRAVGKRFECCRGGGQTFNAGIADLNYLRSFFLEQARGDLSAVKTVIDQNRAQNGWLIFSTHDVCSSPSPYGCTPEFFGAAVRYAAESGATILPVIRAWERLRKTTDTK